MLSFRKPTAESVRRFVQEQSNATFTYPAVGATAETPPDGYVVDRTRVQLGQGEATFRAAQAALRNWTQFRLGWVEPMTPEVPLEQERVVAVAANVWGLWWPNACRIVYVIDESGPITRFGFAYGTLPAHVGTGEERFLVEWNRADESVWYDILAFSRPRHALAKMGYPFMRRIQKRFGRDSARAMLHAVCARTG